MVWDESTSTKPNHFKCRRCTLTHPFNGHFPRLPGWAGTRKVKPIWILLKQETVSGSGISWAICKSAPCSRQITMPAPHHSFFTGRMPFLPPNQQRQSTEGSERTSKLVAALLRVAEVTAGLVESNGSLPPGLWLTSPAGWLPRTGISSRTLCSVIEYGLPLPFLTRVSQHQKGKTNLDFTEARDSEWQWHRLGHMQVCTLLQTDNHASTPPLSFLQAGWPYSHQTNSIKHWRNLSGY